LETTHSRFLHALDDDGSLTTQQTGLFIFVLQQNSVKGKSNIFRALVLYLIPALLESGDYKVNKDTATQTIPRKREQADSALSVASGE